MTNLRLITLLLPVFFLNACAQPPRAIISQVDEGQRSFVTSSAETSTTYLKAEGDKHQFCAGVSPDATYSERSSAGFSLSFLNFGGSPSNDVVSEENSGDEMVGRTPALLLAREILYRSCEMAKNAGLNSQQQMDMFLQSMQTAAEILKNETAKTSISISTQFVSTRAQEIGSGDGDSISSGLVGIADPAANTSEATGTTTAPVATPSYVPPPPSNNAARSSIYGTD